MYAALRHGMGINLGGGFHHAHPDHDHGFCVFNDVAMAVHALRAQGERGRVAIVDTDAQWFGGPRPAGSSPGSNARRPDHRCALRRQPEPEAQRDCATGAARSVCRAGWRRESGVRECAAANFAACGGLHGARTGRFKGLWSGWMKRQWPWCFLLPGGGGGGCQQWRIPTAASPFSNIAEMVRRVGRRCGNSPRARGVGRWVVQPATA